MVLNEPINVTSSGIYEFHCELGSKISPTVTINVVIDMSVICNDKILQVNPR